MPPATIRPPVPTQDPVEAPAGKERSLRDQGWSVVVWNDPITLMSYVVLVIRSLFGYDFETATRLMLQVHHEGKAVVATQPREQAEVSVSQLHGFGLQATLTHV
jgi:ATP-dependent Clp protease adaptor protein ClpS